jgi:hypothetical protein
MPLFVWAVPPPKSAIALSAVHTLAIYVVSQHTVVVLQKNLRFFLIWFVFSTFHALTLTLSSQSWSTCYV